LAAERSASENRKCRLAICDDVPTFRQLVSAVFRWETGFELVGEASNGLEAVELARRVQPDVMLLDIAMPIMDGIEALPKIREASPSTRIIVLTAFGSASIRSRAFADGAVEYLEKGVTPAVMIEAVRRAFDG
jgi:DNA-binding NarL/FixJ family response regulator